MHVPQHVPQPGISTGKAPSEQLKVLSMPALYRPFTAEYTRRAASALNSRHNYRILQRHVVI